MVKIADEATNARRGFDHIGVGVALIVYDDSGRILLMKRGAKARDEHGRWDICGGAIEFGESIEAAIRRELMEEICATPLSVTFLGAYDAHRQHGGQPTHWVQVVHAVRVDPGNVTIGEPHKIDELGWYFSHELPSPLHSQFAKSYSLAQAKGVIR